MQMAIERFRKFTNFQLVIFFQFSIIFIFMLLTILASVWNEPETKKNNQNAAEENFNIGMLHLKGSGVPKNNVKAYEYFERSAEEGFSEAQYWMGRLLGGRLNWLEITKDQKQAVHWYLKASNQGHLASQLFLGRRYYQGDGVPKDFAEAKRWYFEAAKQGDAGAYYFLGVASNDSRYEYMWLWLASNSKSLIPNAVPKEINTELHEVGLKLTQQETIDARYWALSWICTWGNNGSQKLKIQCPQSL